MKANRSNAGKIRLIFPHADDYAGCSQPYHDCRSLALWALIWPILSVWVWETSVGHCFRWLTTASVSVLPGVLLVSDNKGGWGILPSFRFARFSNLAHRTPEMGRETLLNSPSEITVITTRERLGGLVFTLSCNFVALVGYIKGIDYTKSSVPIL